MRSAGHGDLELHDGLEQDWPSPSGSASMNALLAGGDEGDLLGVHGVVLAVVDADPDVLHRVAGDGPVRASPGFTPFSMAGMNCFGTEPPNVVVLEDERSVASRRSSAPASTGSMRRKTSPNWPEPPDCFLWRW